jgi:hypothetical protein
MLKTAHFAFALSLLLTLAPASDAAAKPGASFSHGFSSHASSSHASTFHATPSAPKPGFGSFSRQAAAPSRPAGGFGSFGQGQAAPRQSDSALSQQLSKQSAQAKALETLDQRNAAKAAQNAPQPQPQPAPAYGPSSANTAPMPPAGMQGQAGPTTVVVHQDGGGLGHVIAGAMIARSANAHAQGGYYPAPGYNNGYNGGVNAPANVAHRGSSFFSLFVTLCLLALIAWGLWFAWRGLRRRRAAIDAANKPNYSFERN